VRHLGDLGPAARAVSERLGESTLVRAAEVAEATDRLERERARLTALLTDVPVAMVLVSPAHRIALYDGQAGEMLATVAPPRLNAPITDYLEASALHEAHTRLSETGRPVAFEAASASGTQRFKARLKPLAEAPGYLLILDESEVTLSAAAARPLVYDFALLYRPVPERLEDCPLSDLDCVVFDTETTGLVPHQDEIVQIGAVRVLHGRLIASEVFDLLVDPGRPIPLAASRVHGVTDTRVTGAPGPGEGVRRFHAFAGQSVLVAHNAPFDLAFLNRHAGVAGLAFDQPVLDTVLLSAIVFGASEKHSLDALCMRLGIEIPETERHTALGDARATAQALCALMAMLEARGLSTLGDVLAETRKHGRLLKDMN
jgi:DNA polymerase-3 subunit epsilon